MIYSKEKVSDGNIIEFWYKYNDKHHIIHLKDSTGHESNYVYTYNTNETICKCVEDGKEFIERIDWAGKKVYFKSYNGTEFRYQYDKKGNLLHSKDSTGFECWNKYNRKGNMIYSRDSNGNKSWNKYNEKGKIVYSKIEISPAILKFMEKVHR
jgi:YD repeat-containing protein